MQSHVCMYVYIAVLTHMHAHMHAWTHMHAHMHAWTHMHTHMYTCMNRLRCLAGTCHLVDARKDRVAGACAVPC